MVNALNIDLDRLHESKLQEVTVVEVAGLVSSGVRYESIDEKELLAFKILIIVIKPYN